MTHAPSHDCLLARLCDERDAMTQSLMSMTAELRPVILKRLRRISDIADRLERHVWEPYLAAKYPTETLSDVIG